MSTWHLLSQRNFRPINTCGYNSSTTINSYVLLCFPNVTSANIFPSMGITLPIGPKKRWGCGFTGFPTRDAMCRLFKLVLAPVSTMAQQGRSSTSHFTHIPGFRLKFPVATTFGSSQFLASNTTGSFLCRILKDPGSALLICVSKWRFRAKRLTGGSFLGKTPPGPKSSFIWFHVCLSTYLDREFRPYRFSELRDLSLFVTCSRALNWLIFWVGFSFSVAVEELKISGAEVPATVAPAEPSLNDRFYSFVWDSRARSALFLYIHNIQLSREVGYLNARVRMACLERNRCSCFEVAVAAVVSVVSAQNCCWEDHQRLPPTLSSGQSSMRPSLLSSLLASASLLLSAVSGCHSCSSSAAE